MRPSPRLIVLALVAPACGAGPGRSTPHPIGNHAPAKLTHPPVTGCAWAGHFELDVQGDDGPGCQVSRRLEVELYGAAERRDQFGRVDHASGALLGYVPAKLHAIRLYVPPRTLSTGDSSDGGAVVVQADDNSSDPCDAVFELRGGDGASELRVWVHQVDGVLAGHGQAMDCDAAVTLSGERW